MKIIILILLLCFSINVNANTQNINNQSNVSTQEPLRISALTIEGYDIDFSPEKFEYSLTVPNDLYTLKVSPRPNIGGTVIKLSDNLFNLREGTNITTLTVKDKLGNSTTYTINVTKIKETSDNNLLSDLKIENYDLNFDSQTTSYDLTIKNERELKITPSPESVLSSYEIINNSNLKNDSKIIIKVTAKNGDIKEYIINIKKEFNIIIYLPIILMAGIITISITVLIIVIKKRNKRKQENELFKSNNINLEKTEVFHL